ncbi:MAG: hemerythrin domain-containing protein [Methanomicrobiales archaeon]|nr:hemerythrin domain-containing protein [Methanomicrobiales archaeon]
MAQNLVDVLIQEHQEVMNGLNSIMERGAPPERGTRNPEFDRVHSMFLQHAHGEEEAFYPRIRDEMPDMVRDALNEHEKVRTQMQELASQWHEESEWKSRLQEVKGNIQHHVEDEEQKIFPRTRDMFSTQELEQMAQQFEGAKQRTPGISAAAPGRAEAAR